MKEGTSFVYSKAFERIFSKKEVLRTETKH